VHDEHDAALPHDLPSESAEHARLEAQPARVEERELVERVKRGDEAASGHVARVVRETARLRTLSRC